MSEIGQLGIGIKINEIIKIGDDIEIMLTRVNSSSWVSISIKAPKELKIISPTRRQRKKLVYLK